MRAARLLEGRTDFVIEEIDKPEPSGNTVVVRVLNALLPRYVALLAAGVLSTPKRPFTTGQCAIGVVEEPGEGASGLAVGQMAPSLTMSSCRASALSRCRRVSRPCLRYFAASGAVGRRPSLVP